MRKKGIIATFLAFALIFSALPKAFAETEIIYVSANDTVMPLADETMPIRRGGQIFVPYTIFTQNLSVVGSYDENANQLVLSKGESKMTFNISGNETYDESGEFYTNPAFHSNGNIYVCVADVAGKMGMYYSTITDTLTTEMRTIVRINTVTPLFGDNVYVYLIQKKLESIKAEYYKKDEEPQPIETQPGQPTQPTPVIDTDIYITFSQTPTESTEAILNVLDKFKYSATFFLTGKNIVQYDTTVRRICGEGHSIGISGYTGGSDFYSSVDELTSQLEKTNNLLFKIAGQKTRLVRTPVSSKNNLTSDMRNALVTNGYRFWDWTVSVVGYKKSDTIYSTAVELLKKQKGTVVVLELDNTEQTAEALSKILKYIRQNNYTVKTINEYDTPMNFYQIIQ